MAERIRRIDRSRLAARRKANGAPPAGDEVEKAIASGEAQQITVQFVLTSGDGQGGRTQKPAALVIPADLTEAEAFAFLEAAVMATRKITAAAERARGKGLLVPRQGSGLILPT
jgi:hypothetical protein